MCDESCSLDDLPHAYDPGVVPPRVLLRRFMYDFLQMLAPRLTQRQVLGAENAWNQEAVDREFAGIKIPFLR